MKPASSFIKKVLHYGCSPGITTKNQEPKIYSIQWMRSEWTVKVLYWQLCTHSTGAFSYLPNICDGALEKNQLRLLAIITFPNSSIIDVLTPCLTFTAGNNVFKVNNRNTRRKCDICSKFTIKTPGRIHWRRSGVFTVNFEHISYLVLVFRFLTLNR